MGQLDESELIRRVEAGDEAAFEELVRRHRGSVERLAARMLPDPRDREEACQDVFLKVFRKIGTFRGESRLATWIDSIAYRTFLNRLEGREAPVPGSQLGTGEGRDWFPAGIADEDAAPEERAERSELRSILERAIRRLRPAHRAAITLYHLEGRTVAEIAESLDRAEGTVKSHLYRARRELKEILSETVDVEGLIR